MKTLNSEKNKRIRIALLELLKTEYPGALDIKILLFSLDNLGYPMTEEILSAHLHYLEDKEKGYVALKHKKGYGFEIAFASLTAKGWDLLDGHGNECGIGEKL